MDKSANYLCNSCKYVAGNKKNFLFFHHVSHFVPLNNEKKWDKSIISIAENGETMNTCIDCRKENEKLISQPLKRNCIEILCTCINNV